MKRIEFFGPMGSGKSTLFSDLIKNKSLSGIVNAKEEVYDILLNQVKQNSKTKYFLLRLLFHTPIKDRVFSNYDFYHYLKGDKESDVLLNYVLNDLNVILKSDKAKCLVRLNYLLKDLSDLIVVKNFSNKRLIVHDESLIQRGLSLALDGSLKFFENYFDHTILPDGAIYIKSPLKILKTRILSREINNSGFNGKKPHSKEEIENAFNLSENIHCILKKKNIKLLILDGTKSINENTKIIHDWINENF
jgi:adenylate kinase family enzyme